MIIKRLKVVNFQKHAEGEFEFNSLVNLIIGDNNAGKSALIRAIVWVLTNKPAGAWMRRQKTDRTSAEITFSDGTTVERFVGKSTNGYSVCWADGRKDKFDPCGRDVPEPIRKHFGQLTAQGVPDLLPIASDVSELFFTSSGYGPTARGNILASLTGGHLLHNMRKKGQAQVREDRSFLKTRNADIAETLEEHRLYRTLDEDAEVVAKARKLSAEHDALETKISAIECAIEKRDKAASKYSSARLDVDTIVKAVKVFNDYFIKLMWVNAHTSHANSKRRTAVCSKALATVTKDAKEYKELKKEVDVLSRMIAQKQAYAIARKRKKEIQEELSEYGVCSECGAVIHEG